MSPLSELLSGVGVGEGDGEGDGEVVSTVKVTELLASEPSALVFPAESENLDEATEMTPSVVLLAVGVKVAVYEVEETAFQLEREPPVTETSASTKSVEASERVKVRVDVLPALRELSASSSVMAMVGRTPSITSSLLFPSEFAAPGETKVRFALLAAPVLAFIVPPLSASAEVPVKSRSLVLSPSCTVYVKLRVEVPVPEE